MIAQSGWKSYLNFCNSTAGSLNNILVTSPD